MNSMSTERHSSNSPNKGVSAKVQIVQKAWQTLYCMWGLTLHDTMLQRISPPETCVIYFPFMCHTTIGYWLWLLTFHCFIWRITIHCIIRPHSRQRMR